MIFYGHKRLFYFWFYLLSNLVFKIFAHVAHGLKSYELGKLEAKGVLYLHRHHHNSQRVKFKIVYQMSVETHA